MTLTWECAAYQIVGGREEQEDYCAYRQFGSNLLCVVADGMGGHAAGATAARLAVDRFMESAQDGPPPRSNSFINALNDANAAIASHIDANPETEGMGCTLVGVDLDGECFRWISVGDSKLFHHFANTLEQVNADHSMASRLQIAVKNGDMTAEEAAVSPSRHILLSALTGEAIAKVDVNLKGRTVAIGDLVILASDGLETLAVSEIQTILTDNRRTGIDQLCQALVEAVAARHNPRQDNTTVMIARAIEAKPVDPDDVPTRPVRNGS
jgi:PPM family protein phosphatase